MDRVVLRPQAQLDVEEAALWYEAQRSGLGFEFLDEFSLLLDRIREAPLQFPEIHAGIQRGLLRRFPYSVYFLVTNEQTEVIAVLHQSRSPAAWTQRS